MKQYHWLSLVKKEKLEKKRVLLRIDADVPVEAGKVVEDFRLRAVVPTFEFLLKAGVAQVVVLAHRGRPGGKFVAKLSLAPVVEWFKKRFTLRIQLVNFNKFPQLAGTERQSEKIIFLENLRFWQGEEKNDEQFSRKLANLGDIFVNDAFATFHRAHASIVGIPQFLPTFFGLRFEQEVKTLVWVAKKAPRPVVFVLGGSKRGKIQYIAKLLPWVDFLLVGGALPKYFGKQFNKLRQNKKLIIGKLRADGLDISLLTIAEFKKVIARAATVIWAGPMGAYERVGAQKGTFKIACFIAKQPGYKLAAGGDTHRVLSILGLWQKFDFVSVGGGATLEFLTNPKEFEN